jgi:predicted nucleic acid-binding protein
VNIYVESNFVLEIALEQADAAACERVIDLADSKALRLAIPAYALLEPYETLTRRVREWTRLSSDVESELKQLRRTASLKAEADALVGLTVRAVQLATQKHDSVRARILAAAEVLPIEAITLIEAERLRSDYGLTLPDAVMLASVLLDGKGGTQPSAFLNTKVKDFADPAIRAELTKRSCAFIGRFSAGVAWAEAQLRGR